jgi:hypothetical protein
MRRRHLHRVFNWPLRLFLEASRASVPELQRAIGGIDDGRRVPRTFFASDANRGGVNVGKPRLQRMAGCTRDRVVPGKPRIVVESSARATVSVVGGLSAGRAGRLIAFIGLYRIAKRSRQLRTKKILEAGFFRCHRKPFPEPEMLGRAKLG